MARVAVLIGGVSPEHDISILTGLQAQRGLAGAGHEVLTIFWSKGNEFHLVPNGLEASQFVKGVPVGSERLVLSLSEDPGFYVPAKRLSKPRKLAIDAVLNALHGGPGEDGSIQSLFDLAGIRYTGPNARGAALGMDKLAFAGVCKLAGLPALPRILLHSELADPGFPGPYIVKPRYGGSSIGIDVVEDLATALSRLKANVHHRAGAVLEPYRPDLVDLQIAVRTWPRPELSVVERPLRKGAGAEILSYTDKYVAGGGMAEAPREAPANIPPTLADRIRQAAMALVELVPLRGVCRIDFLSDTAEELYVNEVNTIPGSLSKYLFIDPPVEFGKLLSDMVDEAMSTTTFSTTTQGADGTVLASAASIAAKLG